jgi:hypothetical protein
VDGLYIGSYRATYHAAALRAAGITNVLKLYGDIPDFPEDFNTFENALDDGKYIPDGVLARGVRFVLDRLEAGQPVLVVCGAGISRSSTFVLAALVERGHDLRAAYCLLRRQHPEAQPHPNLWQSLITHYTLDYTLADVLRWKCDED